MNFFRPSVNTISDCHNFDDPLDVLNCSENIKIDKDKKMGVYIFIIATAIVPLSICLFYKLAMLYMRFRERIIIKYNDVENSVFD